MKSNTPTADLIQVAGVCLKGSALVAAAMLLSALVLYLCAGKGISGYMQIRWALSLVVYAVVCFAEGAAAFFLIRRYIEQV